MFSQLGPLFKTTFRQAESSDARMGIRQEEHKGRKNQSEDDDAGHSSSELWDDSIAVSISALKSFLVEFLKTKGVAGTEFFHTEEDASPYAGLTPEKKSPVSPVAARAVKAYGAMAQYAPDPQPAQQPVTRIEASQEYTADSMASEDVRTIYMLIKDLEGLQAAGIEMLQLEKAETFLKSLVDAVGSARSGNIQL